MRVRGQQMCQTCDSTLWVCENHKDRPWNGESDRHDACGCGAGAPCPTCWTDEKFRAQLRHIKDDGRMICYVSGARRR